MTATNVPQPKILTRFTIPSGGWIFGVRLTNTVQYDTQAQVTLAAGDYFVSGDHQSDDFLEEVSSELTTSIQSKGAPFNTMYLLCWIDSNHKVRIRVQGATGSNRDTKIEWTVSDGDEVAKVLGYDDSADDTITGTDNPEFTGDYHHAYGWYSDEDCLVEHPEENTPFTETLQVRTLSGKIMSQQVGDYREFGCQMELLPKAKIWSKDIEYKAAPVFPYTRNAPLECWWYEAVKGTEFRFYRNGSLATNRAVERLKVTGDSGTTVTDSAKAWDTDPQQFAGMLFYGQKDGPTDGSMQGYIISHTATVLTLNTHATGEDWSDVDEICYIMDHRYDTYVLDMSRMQRFEPTRVDQTNRWNINLSFLKYVA